MGYLKTRERKTCSWEGYVVGIPEEVGKGEWDASTIYFLAYKYEILKEFLNKLIFKKRKLS